MVRKKKQKQNQRTKTYKFLENKTTERKLIVWKIERKKICCKQNVEQQKKKKNTLFNARYSTNAKRKGKNVKK